MVDFCMLLQYGEISKNVHKISKNVHKIGTIIIPKLRQGSSNNHVDKVRWVGGWSNVHNCPIEVGRSQLISKENYLFFQEKCQVGVKSTYPRATDTILIFLSKKAPIFVNTSSNYSGLSQHTEIYYSSFRSIFYPT